MLHPTPTHPAPLPWPNQALLSLLPHPSSSRFTIPCYSCSFSLFPPGEVVVVFVLRADPAAGLAAPWGQSIPKPQEHRASPSSALCVPAALLDTSSGSKGSHHCLQLRLASAAAQKNDNLFFSFSTGHQLLVLSALGSSKVTSDQLSEPTASYIHCAVAKDHSSVINCSKSPLPYPNSPSFHPSAGPRR